MLLKQHRAAAAQENAFAGEVVGENISDCRG